MKLRGLLFSISSLCVGGLNPAGPYINFLKGMFQVIASDGEYKSSKALKEAADVIASSPAALQLR